MCILGFGNLSKGLCFEYIRLKCIKILWFYEEKVKNGTFIFITIVQILKTTIKICFLYLK